jgi:hypothetical protein
MDIFDSVEVRWFIDDDDLARAATAIFAGAPPEGRREDRYLVTGRNDIGVKARVEVGKPAKLETKYLLESLGATRLHDRFTGVVERWRKLSLEMADPTLEKNGMWVRVKKSRQLRRFEWTGDGVRPALAGRFAAGCLVELTALEVDIEKRHERSLTLGFEAFGPENLLVEILSRTATAALDTAPFALDAKSSASYPSWLAVLART